MVVECSGTGSLKVQRVLDTFEHCPAAAKHNWVHDDLVIIDVKVDPQPQASVPDDASGRASFLLSSLLKTVSIAIFMLGLAINSLRRSCFDQDR